VNEEAISDTVNEELNIDSDDKMDLEIEGETVSEKSSNEKSESESESETSCASVDEWKEVTMGNKKPKAHTVTKNAGPQFNLLPDAEPIDYFSLFSNDELLNNTVMETNRYAKDKLAAKPKVIWNRWSDISVPEMKAFLGLIINMGLIPLPGIKDYCLVSGQHR
jgi:hypothetical protein